MADAIFEDLLHKEEAKATPKPRLLEKTNTPVFLNGHLIREGTPYRATEASDEV